MLFLSFLFFLIIFQTEPFRHRLRLCVFDSCQSHSGGKQKHLSQWEKPSVLCFSCENTRCQVGNLVVVLISISWLDELVGTTKHGWTFTRCSRLWTAKQSLACVTHFLYFFFFCGFKAQLAASASCFWRNGKRGLRVIKSKGPKLAQRISHYLALKC